MQAIEVFADEREQAPIMLLAAGRIPVRLNLRRLGLHQVADLQPRLGLRRSVPEQEGVARQLDFVRDFQRPARLRCGFEVDDNWPGVARQHQVSPALMARKVSISPLASMLDSSASGLENIFWASCSMPRLPSLRICLAS